MAKRTSFLIIEMLVTTRKRVLADVESIIDLADKLAATGLLYRPGDDPGRLPRSRVENSPRCFCGICDHHGWLDVVAELL